MIFNTYTVPLIISGIFMLAIALWVWQHQTTKGAKYLALLLVSCAVYAVGYAFEISSDHLEHVLFWLKIEYIGISGLPAFLILFAISYTNPDIKLTKAVKTALFVIPVLTLLLMSTSDYHHFYFQAARMSQDGPFATVIFDRGFFYWIHVSYIGLAVLFSNIMFALMFFKTSKSYRFQLSLLLIGSLVPWVASIFYHLRLMPWNLDLSPYAFTLSGLFIFWGLIHHHLLDLLPVARTTLFEELPDGVIVLDNQLRIVDLNTAARRYLQTDKTVLGNFAAEIIPNWEQLVERYHKTVPGVNMEIEHALNEQQFWLQVDAFPLENKQGIMTGHMVLLRDITERKKIEEKLKILATTDDLTGLWNRRYLFSAIKSELNRAERYNQSFSLIMLDIDRFKDINDCFGHAAGDAVLRHLSLQLKSRLRKTDIVGRLGGEEFCILMPNSIVDDAVKLAETIRLSAANTPVTYQKHDICITVSIGVTSYQHSNDMDTLLKMADDALYEAKNRGRNSIVVKTSVG